MLTIRQAYQIIWSDIRTVYSHFLHWNLSKIVLSVYSIIASILFSVPFVGVILGGMYTLAPAIQKLPATKPEAIVDVAFSHPVALLLILLSGVCIIGIFAFFYSYYFYLLSFVYRSYTRGERVGYFEHRFFSGKHLWKFMGVMGWTGLYILAPICIGAIVICALAAATALTDTETSKILFSILAFVTLLVSVFILVYWSLRLVSANFVLVEAETLDQPAKNFTDESLRLSQNKFWYIVGVVLPPIAALVIIQGIFSEIQENASTIMTATLGILSFLLIDGLAYSIYYSLYRILKDQNPSASHDTASLPETPAKKQSPDDAL